MKRLKDNFRSLIDCIKAGPDWFNRVAKLVNSVLNEMQVVGGELQTDSMGRINKLVTNQFIMVGCISAGSDYGLWNMKELDPTAGSGVHFKSDGRMFEDVQVLDDIWKTAKLQPYDSEADYPEYETSYGYIVCDVNGKLWLLVSAGGWGYFGGE